MHYYVGWSSYTTNNGRTFYDWAWTEVNTSEQQEATYKEYEISFRSFGGTVVKKNIDIPEGYRLTWRSNQDVNQDSNYSGTSEVYELINNNTANLDHPNPAGATHLIELKLPPKFVDSLANSSDFFIKLGNTCDYAGYELTNVYSPYAGDYDFNDTLYINVKKRGSWSIVKLIAAIIGIIIIVLLATFSGSVILGVFAVAGAYIAIHYVVKSVINQEIIASGQESIQNGMNTVGEVAKEILNDPNLTPEQKEELIKELIKILKQSAIELGLKVPSDFDSDSDSDLGKALKLIPVLLVAAFAIMLFLQMKRKNG